MGKLTLYIPDNKQEVVEKAKLLATVLHESLSNLIVDFLERYLEEHKEELKAIERLQAKARKG
jgi:ferritin